MDFCLRLDSFDRADGPVCLIQMLNGAGIDKMLPTGNENIDQLISQITVEIVSCGKLFCITNQLCFTSMVNHMEQYEIY